MKTRFNAVPLRVGLLIAEHCQDLAHNFAGGQVAAQPQQGCHTESAIDGAAHLAGDADSGAMPILLARQLFIAALRAVAGLAAIALRHPDGLHALPIGKAKQIAHGAIARNKLLLNARSADGEAQLTQPPADAQRQGRELLPA